MKILVKNPNIVLNTLTGKLYEDSNWDREELNKPVVFGFDSTLDTFRVYLGGVINQYKGLSESVTKFDSNKVLVIEEEISNTDDINIQEDIPENAGILRAVDDIPDFNKRQIQRTIDKSLTWLKTHEPLAFWTFMNLKVVYKKDKNLTMGVDGIHIFIGVPWASSLKESQINFVLLHEMLHIILMHVPPRVHNANPYLWNIACDAIINQYIMRQYNINDKYQAGSEINFPYGGVYLKDKVKLETTDAVDIYYMLLKEQKQMQDIINDLMSGQSDGQSQEQGNGHGQLNSDIVGGTFDPKSSDILKSDVTKDMSEEQLKSATSLGRSSAVRVCGIGAGSGLLKSLIETSEQTIPDWIPMMRKFMRKEISNNKNWSRVTRTSTYYITNGAVLARNKAKSKNKLKDILIAIDTSGSITDDDMIQFLSDLNGIAGQYKKYTNTKVIQWGCSIVSETNINTGKDFKNVKFVDGGGTDINAVINYVHKCKDEGEIFKGVVIYTDGAFDQAPLKQLADEVTLAVVLSCKDGAKNLIELLGSSRVFLKS